MRAILIDPVNQTITQIEILPDLAGFRAAIGCRRIETYCRFEPTPEVLTGDEEALYQERVSYFSITFGPDDVLHFPGRCIISVLDPNTGKDQPCRLPLEAVQAVTAFCSEEESNRLRAGAIAGSGQVSDWDFFAPEQPATLPR